MLFRSMLLVAESTAKSAVIREESRGGHTRDDFPTMSAKWRLVNNISTFDGSKVSVRQESIPELRKDLFELFDIHELEKYMTPEELAKGGA